MSLDFLGKGLKFPFGFTRSSGGAHSTAGCQYSSRSAGPKAGS